MCSTELFGPWQFSHWMFANWAVLGNLVSTFVQLLGLALVSIPEDKKPAKSLASSMPPLTAVLLLSQPTA